MNDAKPDVNELQEPRDAGSISALLTEYEQLAPTSIEAMGAFADRWVSDVQPVHERTERSRTFRTVYIVIGVLLAIGLNVGALFAWPAMLERLPWLGEADAGVMLRPPLLFLIGAGIGLVELTLWFITLDSDVMRQKRERLAARLRLVAAVSGGPHESLGSFLGKLRRTESFYWRIGVGLAWTNVILQLVAYGCFIYGVLLMGLPLATAAG